MSKRLLNALPESLDLSELHRPDSVDELSWRAFLAYVRDAKTLAEISAELGLPAFGAGRMVLRVDKELSHHSRQADQKKRTALDSPIEVLGLSMRSRNALRKLGCDTIQSLLDRDFSRAVRGFGSISRHEVATALIRHGLNPPPTLESREPTVAALAQDVSELRQRLEYTYRLWLTHIERLEESVRKLRGSAQ